MILSIVPLILLIILYKQCVLIQFIVSSQRQFKCETNVHEMVTIQLKYVWIYMIAVEVFFYVKGNIRNLYC